MTTIEELRPLFRSYKRNAWKLRRLLVDSSADLGLSFQLSGKKDEPVEMTFTKGSDVARHAALLRPFMALQSPIELRRVWEALLATGALDDETQVAIEEAFRDADSLPISAVVNGTALTARDIYDAYGEGEYFATEVTARERFEAMSIGPMAGMVQLLFHEVCRNYSRLAFVLLEVIRQFERKHPAATAKAFGQCIYCKTTDDEFRTEEHVIPEALGADELVLTGCVCDHCNNRLSRLDQALVEWDYIAMLRTMYVPLTKKGRFPRAELREYDIRKTEPRNIHINAKRAQPAPVFEETEDGTVRWTMKSQSKRRFDPLELARPLFKIALGLVAHQVGPEAALDARYDPARAFVSGKCRFPGYLVVPTQHTPGPEIRTWWQPFNGATGVAISIFGLQFSFGIEPITEPIPAIPEELAGTFWLGDSPEPERGPWPPDGRQDG